VICLEISLLFERNLKKLRKNFGEIGSLLLEADFGIETQTKIPEYPDKNTRIPRQKYPNTQTKIPENRPIIYKVMS
jgi:hypothetical protein